MAGLLLALRQLLALGALTATSWLWGRRATTLILGSAAPPPATLETFGLAVACGLGTLSTALFLLGLAGWLTPAAVGLLVAAGAVMGLAPGLRPSPRAARAGADRAQAEPAAISARPATAPPVGRPALVLAALLLLPTFVLSLYPPTGFDETTYHLPFAAAFAHDHRLEVLPDIVFPVAPQLIELLFAALLATAGDVATHTIQLLCMAATAAALFAAGERFAGRRAGAIAAALWLANPLVHYLAASAYVDLGVALFCLLAVVAWERWRSEGWRPWLVLAGLLAGFAADTKYLGLPWLALLGLGTWLAGPRRRRWAATGLFAAGAVLALAPTYLHILAETGNPTFPILSNWFPGTGSRLERLIGVPAAVAWGPSTHWYAAQLRGAWRQPWSLLAFPWRVAFDRAVFNFQAPLSPCYLGVLPLMAWQAWRDPRLRRWLLLVLAYAALGTASDPRYQLPSAALLSLGGGICLARLLNHPRLARFARPGAVAALAVGLAALGSLYAAYKVARRGPPPTTAAARAAFLGRELAGYPALHELNARCGSRYTVFGLEAENLTYYAEGRFLGQRGGPFDQRWVAPLLLDAERLHAALGRWGVEYLLVNHPPAGLAAWPPGREAAFGLRFRPLLATPGTDLFALLDAQGRPEARCRFGALQGP
jgi:4-amino-4-deoxy-L-arabinose transferase-like glycosyltransferase